MADSWADELGNPQSLRPVPLGFPWGLHRATHASLHGNYLHITTKGPTTQSNLLYMLRWSQVSWEPSLYKEILSYQGIQVSSLPLYKPQTWPFLRYVNPPYLLHSWVLREFSITDLTFRGSLTGIHWCPLIGSFLLFFRHIHWHVCGWSTHWWFLCIIMPKL